MTDIIALCGAAGSGKDTVANHLLGHGFKRFALADSLKQICSDVFLISNNHFHDICLKDADFMHPVLVNDFHIENLIKTMDKYGKITDKKKKKLKEFKGKLFITPRDMLQFVGTEIIRPLFGENTFLNVLLNNIKNESKVVVTDVRFHNELNTLMSLKAKALYVYRLNAEVKADSHASEENRHTLKNSCQVINNNGTIEELNVEIDRLIVA